MARYAAKFSQATLTTTFKTAGNLRAPAASMRRIKLYDLLVGSGGTPADNVLEFNVKRTSANGTDTAVTPLPLDPGRCGLRRHDGQQCHSGADHHGQHRPIGLQLEPARQLSLGRGSWLRAGNSGHGERWPVRPGPEPGLYRRGRWLALVRGTVRLEKRRRSPDRALAMRAWWRWTPSPVRTVSASPKCLVRCAPEDLGGHCRCCDKLICSGCVEAMHRGENCTPWEKQMIAMENREAARRSYGI
jgi:hypothetical protein